MFISCMMTCFAFIYLLYCKVIVYFFYKTIILFLFWSLLIGNLVTFSRRFSNILWICEKKAIRNLEILLVILQNCWKFQRTMQRSSELPVPMPQLVLLSPWSSRISFPAQNLHWQGSWKHNGTLCNWTLLHIFSKTSIGK
jgi:hypothetical protein